MAKSTRIYTHYNVAGKKARASLKQLVKWNRIVKGDSKNAIKRKTQNLDRVLRRKTLSESAKLIFLNAKNMQLRLDLLEAVQEAQEAAAEAVSAAKAEPKESGGLTVTALIGLSYDSKKEPLYAELAAVFKFKDRRNYNPASVIEALEDKLNQIWHGWWESGYAVDVLFSRAEFLTDGAAPEGRRYGIGQEIEEENERSEVEHEFFVSYKQGRGRGKLIDKGTNSNPLESI